MNVRRRRRVVAQDFATLARSGAFAPTSWYATYEVGTGKTYASIGEAITAANSACAAGTGRGYAPWWRQRILIYPGTYTEQLITQDSFIDFVGATGNADDVVIQNVGADDTPVLRATSTSCYCAHLTLKLLDGTKGSHYRAPLWVTNGLQSQTLSFENVKFISEQQQASGYGIGATVQPGDNSTYVFVRCHFQIVEFSDQGQAFDVQYNQNLTARTAPGYVFCVDCTTEGGGTDAAQCSVAFVDLGGTAPVNGVQDVAAWIGGTIDRPGGTGHQLNCVGWNPTGSHFTAKMWVDPAISDVSVDADVTANVTRAIYTDVAYAPINAVGLGTRDYYYPSGVGASATVSPAATAGTASALTANRVYYVPVNLTESHILTSIRQVVTGTSDGKVWMSLYKDDGTGKPGGFINRAGGSGTTPSVGTISQTAFTYANLPLYRGRGTVWIGLVCSDGTAEFQCSTAMDDEHSVYYEDIADPSVAPVTASPTILGVGTSFPLPYLNLT